MPLTHNHYCQHCDRIFGCIADPCLLSGKSLATGTTRRYATRKTQGKVKSLPPHVSDISHLHDCEQAEKYREATRNAMRDNNRGCRYGCSRLPCMHGASIRFPRVGGSVGHRDYSNRDREFNPILWSKPVGRRLRDHVDASFGGIAPAIGKTPNFGFNAPTEPTRLPVAPTAERASATNVARTVAISDATADRETGAPVATADDYNKLVDESGNRYCEGI